MEHDLSERVALLEFVVGIADLFESVCVGDRDLEFAVGDQLRELGEHVGAGALSAAVGLSGVAGRLLGRRRWC